MKYVNSLIDASSPYLKQHAHNPVDWHVWNDAALQKALDEDKPLLISIGYAACHWCHVMAHESFEDQDTARIMNEHFVCIKVDREERPDIDQVYMDAVQAMTGSGGWPLHVFALPDGRPFFGGTYFHKEQWRQVLQAVAREYRVNRQHLIDYAANLQAGLSNPLPVQVSPAELPFSNNKLHAMLASWKKHFDRQEGGDQRAPKFPLPVNLGFLLDYAILSHDEEVRAHVLLTLDKMALGGIYDQVGGGFARYSTDRNWKVPHFEKMLYDNAQLISLYSRAYRLTSSDLYRRVVEDTLAFLVREMQGPHGLFYSSLDADSEGQEGKFYIWTEQELRQVLGAEYEVAALIFELNDRGLWKDGQFILLHNPDLQQVADRLGISLPDLEERRSKIQNKLFAVREKRTKPPLDDKALTSWNGLMLTALADAGQAFADMRCLSLAEDLAAVMLGKLSSPDGGLFHTYIKKVPSIPGFLEDYAFVIEGLLALYQATFKQDYVHQAERLTAYAIEHFLDEESHFFFFTHAQQKQLIVRRIEVVDGVLPSSCSSLAHSLFYLSRLLERPEWEHMALSMLASLEKTMLRSPGSFSNWARLYLTQVFPFNEIVLTGEKAPAFRDQLQRVFLPNTLLAGGQQDGGLPILRDRFQPGRSLMYVCQDKVCGQPVQEVSQVVRKIHSSLPSH